MGGEPIYILALGASTPLGRDAWSSAAAVRAGISGFGQHPYMIDTAGAPMLVANAPWLDIGLTGIERFEALLLPAIDQVLEPLDITASKQLSVALALGLPNSRPGLPALLQSTLMVTLGKRYGRIFSSAAVFPVGHASGLLALDAASRKLRSGTLDTCVIAGVDTYLEPETLEWLEECDQLHGAGRLNNAWGFIPGEAAGALLLMRDGIIQRLRLTPIARLLGLGTAHEPKRIKSETVCIGEGLTKAFRGALKGLPHGILVSDIYCDMNGEPYRADEYGFTCLRTKESFMSGSDFVAPAECWGDVSAAGSLLHLGLAAIAGVKQYANGSYALIWASSEGGERATALVEVRRSG